MGLTPTVPWTTDEAYQNTKLTGGRPSLVLREVKRLLKTQLPPLIDRYNTERNLTGSAAMQKPGANSYKSAPAVLAAKHKNCVLVGMSVEKIAMPDKKFQDRIILSVFVIDDAIDDDDQIELNWDRVKLAETILLRYYPGCINPDGVYCWKRLRPLGSEMLPEAWADFSGVTLNYEVLQDPGWSVFPGT